MDCFCAKPRSIQIKIILLDEQELFHEVQVSTVTNIRSTVVVVLILFVL